MSFGFDLGCLDAEFGMDIQDPQRMNPNSFGDSLTLHLAAGAGQNVCLSRIKFPSHLGQFYFTTNGLTKHFGVVHSLTKRQSVQSTGKQLHLKAWEEF